MSHNGEVFVLYYSPGGFSLDRIKIPLHILLKCQTGCNSNLYSFELNGTKRRLSDNYVPLRYDNILTHLKGRGCAHLHYI